VLVRWHRGHAPIFGIRLIVTLFVVLDL
jgi:hypothetical protein